MVITRVKDRSDFFAPEHAAMHADFGFTGSNSTPGTDADGYPNNFNYQNGPDVSGAPNVPDTKGSNPDAPSPPHGYAMGGDVHPHGHMPYRTEMQTDGCTVEHHAHGGMTVHHPDGMVTHHTFDRAPVENKFAGADGMAKGGSANSDAAADRALIMKMINQHEKSEGAEPMGKRLGGHVRLPAGMRAQEMRSHSPIQTPPRKPQVTNTPTNSMPGGVMPYGVQPSTEGGYRPSSPTGGDSPDGMKKGGKVKKR